jgi:oxygen-dependent protoporphyrinogen oxidase
MAGGALRVVVIGGGLSGLTAAYALIRDANRAGRDIKVTLLEAADRLGGNIHTERFDGFVVESGPDAFVVSRPHALHLCEDLGLGQRLVETRPENRRVYIARRGKLVPIPEGLVLGIPSRLRAFLRSPLISVRGKLRVLREMAGTTPDTSGGDVSIGEFLERRFGKEMVDVVLEPLLGGIYAGDAFHLSLRSTFPDWFAENGGGTSLLRKTRAARKAQGGPPTPRSPFRSLAGGMGELVETLTDRIGRGPIHVRAKVTAVQRPGSAFRVALTDGEIEADHVVVALPADRAGRVLAPLDGDLSRELETIGYVSTAVVTFGYAREAIGHPLDASGFLVPKSEGCKITAGTFVSSKWNGRAPPGAAVVRGFVGGAHDETTPTLPDEELVSTVRSELERMLAIRAAPRFARVSRYVKASPQPAVGHFERVSRIRNLAQKVPGLYLIGNAYDGVGIPDCVRLAEEAAASIQRASKAS